MTKPVRASAREIDNFDERQIAVRGKVYRDCLLAAFVSLFVNAAINAGFVWATGFTQSITVAILIVTFGTIEMLARGVYFSKSNKAHGIHILFTIVTAICVTLLVSDLAHHEVFIENNALNDHGLVLALTPLFAIMAISMWVGWTRGGNQKELD